MSVFAVLSGSNWPLLDDLVVGRAKQRFYAFLSIRTCLGSAVTNDGICDTGIRRRIAIAKDGFPKISKVVRDRKILLEAKKRELDCYPLHSS